MENNPTEKSAWNSIVDLKKIRPALTPKIDAMNGKAGFLESEERTIWQELVQREYQAFPPGLITQHSRRPKHGIGTNDIALNMVRSLFLQYWLRTEAPQIYTQCQQILESAKKNEAPTKPIEKHLPEKIKKIEDIGLYEETESYALSNVALLITRNQRKYEHQLFTVLNKQLPNIPNGWNSEEYSFCQEIVANRIKSAQSKKTQNISDKTIKEALKSMGESNNLIHGVEIIGATKNGEQSIINLAMANIKNIVLSAIHTCHKNAHQLDSKRNTDFFPHYTGKGQGPSQSFFHSKNKP